MPKRNVACSFVLATKEPKMPSQHKASFAAQAIALQNCCFGPQPTGKVPKAIYHRSWVLTLKNKIMLALYFHDRKDPALSCAVITGFETFTTIVAQGAAGSFLGTSFDGQKKYKS